MSRAAEGRPGKDIIIAVIQDYYRETGKVPGCDEIRRYIADRARVVFGSWEKAVKAAGLKPGRHEWTDEEVLNRLAELRVKLGRIPTWADINASGDRLANQVTARFKSLALAMEKATGINMEETTLLAVSSLTDGRCPEASNVEIVDWITAAGIPCNTAQVRGTCGRLVKRGLLELRGTGRIATYAMTEKGREELKAHPSIPERSRVLLAGGEARKGAR